MVGDGVKVNLVNGVVVAPVENLKRRVTPIDQDDTVSRSDASEIKTEVVQSSDYLGGKLRWQPGAVENKGENFPGLNGKTFPHYRLSSGRCRDGKCPAVAGSKQGEQNRCEDNNTDVVE